MSAPEAPELEAHRRALVRLGYRMLGSLADAEDVAQEALLRLHQADPAPERPRAWLVRVTTRLSLDRLRELRRRREAYVGSWLPDMVVTDAGADPSEDVALADSLSLALLVVLEALSPLERAAFVLHDVFGYDYGELAGILDREEAACRQLASRARRRLADRRTRFEPDAGRRAEVAHAFMRAAAEGEMEPLVGLLVDDVVLRADAAGRRPAPRRPLEGPALVAKFLLTVARKGGRDAEYSLLTVNGTPGFLVTIDGEPDSIYGLDVAEDRIAAIHVVREPDKVRAALARLP